MDDVIHTAGNRYVDGSYLLDNPDWHQDDAEWKSNHIINILERNGVVPQSLCEIGCGSGAITELLARKYSSATAHGYEISPQAFQLCKLRRTERLDFFLANPFEAGRHYDVSMAIDVVEHLEAPFEFVRSMRSIAGHHIFHFPLDMNALTVARGWSLMAARNDLGHLAYYTRDTALALLEECGHHVIDSFYTPWAIDQSHKTWKKRLAAIPRRIAFAIAPDATVRLIGGWSLMVLTRSKP